MASNTTQVASLEIGGEAMPCHSVDISFQPILESGAKPIEFRDYQIEASIKIDTDCVWIPIDSITAEMTDGSKKRVWLEGGRMRIVKDEDGDWRYEISAADARVQEL